MGRGVRALGRALDAVSAALFALAGAALVLAAGLTAFEVAARYGFNAPTTWSGDAVSLCLAVVIFAALPQVTREGGHIVVDLVTEALPPRGGRAVDRLGTGLAALAAGAAAAIAGAEAWRQFEGGLMTSGAHPIPRWWVTAWVALGLALCALHLLRALARR